MAFEIIEYSNEVEKNLFRQWFLELNACAAAKVTTAIVRLETATRQTQKVSAGASMSIKSISAQDTVSILHMTAKQ
jgi:hypothetical protein